MTATAVTAPLPQEGGITYTSMFVTVTDSADFGTTTFAASRTKGAGGIVPDTRSLAAEQAGQIVENLVAATIDPTTATIQLNEEKTFTLSILPRGNTEGVVQLYPSMSSANSDFVVDPPRIDVTMIRGSTVPVTKTVRVTPTGIHSEGPHLEVKMAPNVLLADARIFSVGSTNPDFNLSATPLEVTVANGVSSIPVQFALKAFNGFAGNIKITWVGNEGVSPQPDDNDFIMNLGTNQHKTFSRTFYRYTTGNEAIPITFNATNIPFTKTRTVTINVKHP